MKKKRQLTNRLQPTSGGWAALRLVKYTGTVNQFDLDYHVVQLIVNYKEWEQMSDWCIKTLGVCSTENGPGIWTPKQRWYVNNGKFWFREQGDMEWFMLTWS